MPYVRLETSISIPPEAAQALAQRLSAKTAQLLSKPEAYVMTAVQTSVPMTMGGTPDPAAFVDLRALGEISGDKARSLSAELTSVLSDSLAVPKERVFLNFSSMSPQLWGHAGHTFG